MNQFNYELKVVNDVLFIGVTTNNILTDKALFNLDEKLKRAFSPLEKHFEKVVFIYGKEVKLFN